MVQAMVMNFITHQSSGDANGELWLDCSETSVFHLMNYDELYLIDDVWL